jgi:hypothetical protein
MMSRSVPNLLGRWWLCGLCLLAPAARADVPKSPELTDLDTLTERNWSPESGPGAPPSRAWHTQGSKPVIGPPPFPEGSFFVSGIAGSEYLPIPGLDVAVMHREGTTRTGWGFHLMIGGGQGPTELLLRGRVVIYPGHEEQDLPGMVSAGLDLGLGFERTFLSRSSVLRLEPFVTVQGLGLDTAESDDSESSEGFEQTLVGPGLNLAWRVMAIDEEARYGHGRRIQNAFGLELGARGEFLAVAEGLPGDPIVVVGGYLRIRTDSF